MELHGSSWHLQVSLSCRVEQWVLCLAAGMEVRGIQLGRRQMGAWIAALLCCLALCRTGRVRQLLLQQLIGELLQSLIGFVPHAVMA